MKMGKRVMFPAYTTFNETIETDDFEFFRSELQSRAGISLSNSKRSLAQARLRSRVQALNLDCYRAYRQHLSALNPEDPEWQVFINLLTTNKTEWFREPQHFQYLMNVYLPNWMKLGRDKLRVWSAASSTGEEPYSLGFVLDRFFEGTGRDFEVLASDIDTEVLRRAQQGVYPISALESVPSEYWERCLCRGTDDIANWAKVRNAIKRKIRFQPHNLLSGPLESTDGFDLIFCRNVLIYFSESTIAEVARHLHASATPGASLIIGRSEALNNIKTPWRFRSPSIYQRS